MKKEKTLQKLTDYKNINSVYQLKKHLKLYPETKNEVDESIRARISEAYNSTEMDEYNLVEMLVYITVDKGVKEDIRNTTYELKHSIITSFINNYILQNRHFPTIGNIKENTKLSRQTIYNHLNNGFLNTHNKLIKGKNEIMSINALQKLYLIGVEDNNPTALKHFIKLSGVVLENKTPQVSNYIQINNLKISNDHISKLPIEDILQIEKIISKTL